MKVHVSELDVIYVLLGSLLRNSGGRVEVGGTTLFLCQIYFTSRLPNIELRFLGNII